MFEPRLNKGDIVMHFKREMLSDSYKRTSNQYFYKVCEIATDADTGRKIVVYQALYKPYQVFTRPLGNFLGEVDKDKYPLIEQKYRFEKVVPTWSIIIRRLLQK